MTFEALVFDCDGVLVESTAANVAYYNTILRQLGQPEVGLDESEKVRLCHTASTPDVLAGLLGEAAVPAGMAVAGTLGYAEFIPWLRLEPGVAETLRELSSRMPLAVATNRGTSIEPILEHFGLRSYFSVVVGLRDVARPKPWPDMLELVSQRLGVAPSRMLFVGDSDLDCRAARAAGMAFAAYRAPHLDGRALESHGELLELLVSGK